jgi:hypothetical protein
MVLRRSGEVQALLAGLAACMVPAMAGAQVVDNRIPLNYNFHGMVHSAGITGTVDEWTTVATNANADQPKSYRSIADRGLIFDPLNNRSPAAYTGQSVGLTGMSYAFFDTLGYANCTDPEAPRAGLDIVHLGSRCAGFNPSTIWAYETVANPATNVGIAPSWGACDHSNAAPQMTTFAPITLDAAAEIGVLYQITSSGGQFDVVLGFSDRGPITVRLAGPDWFGIPTNSAILANNPVSSQGKIGYTVSGTTFRSFQGTDNNDAPVIKAVTTGAGPNLNIMEGVISIPKIILGTGTFPATPDIVGKHLTSVTFQNATYPASGGRAYAIFAATVRSGQPVRANCATPQVVTAGVTATDNIHTGGAAPSSCGTNDTTAVYYSYTAQTTGTIEARTCGAGFDTTLSVSEGCGGPTIICNDNACGTASRAQWSAIAGRTYLIRIAGNNAATGSFNLTIDDPLPSYLYVPLTYNWNGMSNTAAEQGTANRDNPNGYRSIADRGLLLGTGATNTIDAVPLFDADFMPFKITTDVGALDCVHLGDRRFVAGSARNWGTGTTQGLQPTWLPDNDHTIPQVSDISSLHATIQPTTRIGFIYQISNSGGRFDTLITFADNTNVIVTMRANDWFGNVNPPAPVAGSGLLAQRQLGVYASTQNADNADTTTSTLNVTEAVISVQSLIAAGFPDPTGKELKSISFSNPVSNSSFTTSTPANASGFAILAATLRNTGIGRPPCPADFNHDGGVDGGDVEAFFASWESGSGDADVNFDGGVDGGDIETFFAAWEAGGC